MRLINEHICLGPFDLPILVSEEDSHVENCLIEHVGSKFGRVLFKHSDLIHVTAQRCCIVGNVFLCNGPESTFGIGLRGYIKDIGIWLYARLPLSWKMAYLRNRPPFSAAAISIGE